MGAEVGSQKPVCKFGRRIENNLTTLRVGIPLPWDVLCPLPTSRPEAHCFHPHGRYGPKGRWEKHNDRVRDRRRDDGCDPPRGGSATAASVAAILWLLYAVYERLVATGVLCEAHCNIRVDLVLFIPILGIATFCAYQAYVGRPGQSSQYRNRQ